MIWDRKWDDEFFGAELEIPLKFQTVKILAFRVTTDWGRLYSATWLFNICFRVSSFHLAGEHQHHTYMERLGCLVFCECICGTCFESNYPWLAPGWDKDSGQFKMMLHIKRPAKNADNQRLSSIIRLPNVTMFIITSCELKVQSAKSGKSWVARINWRMR